MQCKSIFTLAVIFLMFLFSAQAQGADTSQSGGVNRAELAGSLLRVERCFYGQKWSDADKATFNKGFDDATLLFFGGDFPKAMKAMNTLVLAWHAEYKTQPTMPYLAAMRLQVSPRVWALDSGIVPSIKISTAYEVADAARPENLKIFLAPYSAKGAASDALIPLEAIALPDDAAPLALDVPLPLPEKGISPGLYNLYVADGDASKPEARWLSTTWAVVDTSLDATAAANKATLAELNPETPTLQQAKVAIESRNNLLIDKPTDQKSTDYVLDPNQLKREIAEEITALQSGNNPFNKRKGDYWRVYKTLVGKVPARVYAPEGLDLEQAVPLVIAFHGAGGDENMFMEAYGLGKIKTLADEHKFLLLSPLSYPFTGATAGSSVKQILEVLKEEYPIDDKRIYVLGHSMGGAATCALVNSAPELCAAAASLCGVGTPDSKVKNFPPMLLVAAELDPLAKADEIEAKYNDAKAAGLPVEHQLKAHYGHTLVVGDILADVINWLMKEHTK